MPATKLDLNEIAAVDVKTTLPLFFDPYKKNRSTGSFIVIDPLTNATVGAGIIESAIAGNGSHSHATERKRSTKEERVFRFGIRPRPYGCRDVLTSPKWSSVKCSTRAGTCRWRVRTIFSRTNSSPSPKAFHLSGNITIFAPLDDGTNPKTVVRAIYGPESFFAVRITDDTDEEAVERIMKVLRKWRDAQSDAEKKKS